MTQLDALLTKIKVPPAEARRGALPVIFYGQHPRHVGFAETLSEADLRMYHARVSCRYVSLAEKNNTRFFIGHGQ